MDGSLIYYYTYNKIFFNIMISSGPEEVTVPACLIRF